MVNAQQNLEEKLWDNLNKLKLKIIYQSLDLHISNILKKIDFINKIFLTFDI